MASEQGVDSITQGRPGEPAANGEYAELHAITTERLRASDVWHQVWPNSAGAEARGCRDAATVRNRLGSAEHGGVPLWAELKSEIGFVVRRSTGERLYYAAHTRGNTCVDRERIAAILGVEFSDCDFQIRIDKDAVDAERATDSERDGAKGDSSVFGLVNPLNIDVLFRIEGHEVTATDIYQLFDESLRLEAGHPRTVTTNSGRRVEAFEIAAEDLIAAVTKLFPRTKVGRFSYPDPVWLGEGEFRKDYWLRFPPPAGPKVGILTGNAPESGLALWSDFLARYRALFQNTTDVLMPEVTIYSLPAMGLSMEIIRREDSVWAEIEKAVHELLAAGCRIITVACNTTIHFEPEIRSLCRDHGVEFASIAEACLPEIRRGLRETAADGGDGDLVGLVGIGPVIDLNGGYSGYARYFRDHDIRVKSCSAMHLAYVVKNVGVDSLRKTDRRRGAEAKRDAHAKRKNVVTEFRKLIKQGLPDVRVIVLALTEASLAYRQHLETAPAKHVDGRVYVDPVYELARHLVFTYLRRGYRDAAVCQIPANFDLDGKLSEFVYGGPDST